MRFVTPEVVRLAATKLDTDGLYRFLECVGAPDWTTDAPSDGEELIEIAGRTCYLSFDPELNRNLTEVRKGNQAYLANLIKQQHLSVLEHTTSTYALLGVTRVLADELKRHRHLSWSETSLRFVRLTELGAYLPKPFTENERAREVMVRVFETCEQAQRELAELFDLDNQDFTRKKEITSAMRRAAPSGLVTSLIVTGNLRTWREIIMKRATPHAEEEIRGVVAAIAADLKALYPHAMGDLT
jgi:thymidylate synthase (FAD)